MKLYHGTNTDFLEIDLSQSNRFKDFGRGFYLTDIKRQAEEMARRRVLQNGGMPIVQVYEFDDKCLIENSMCLGSTDHLPNGQNLSSKTAAVENLFSNIITTLL